jgi:hypothetical protein
MVTVKRPRRVFSFTDHAKQQPKAPPPGDRLDAQFMDLSDAIRSTQDALAEIRRDDGQLNNNSVTEHHLATDLRQKIIGDVQAQLAPVALQISGTAATARDAERNAQLYAEDAEKAVATAQLLVNGLAALRELITAKSDTTAATQDVVAMLNTEAENWANYSKANADNAIKAKDEALAWAEYLAGPVVNSGEAPAYIAGSPFPNGLYYQPVQGGVAGLWSAKWWALQAYNLVGAAGQFFLGPWPAGPLPGEQNPETGQVAPDPIPPGSIYYDLSSGSIMVWDGDSWEQSIALVASYQASFVYQATAGQTSFSGADLNGQTPTVGDFPSEVHVNGVRLVPTLDYTVDVGTNTLHIGTPLTLNSMVQWDLLVAPLSVPPPPPAATIKAWKIAQLVPDGTTQNFPLNYNNGTATVPANVGSSPELLVTLDGTPQEPGVDFSASGSALHLVTAPLADAHLWAVWYQPEAAP